MRRVLRIEHHRGATRRVERGGDFLADVAGFPDADDDDLAAFVERVVQQVHGGDEISVQPRGHLLEPLHLHLDDPSRLGQVIHGPCQTRRPALGKRGPGAVFRARLARPGAASCPP